jgi:hypothetical protein
MVYTPKAIIWHKESMTIGKQSAFKAYYDAKNPPIVIARHQSRKYFKKFIKSHIWSHVIKASIKSILLEHNISKAAKIISGLVDGLNLIKKLNINFKNDEKLKN